VLDRGVIDQNAIRSCVQSSQYFAKEADEPAWRTVWYWFERSPEQFNAALSTLERQFAARDFTVVGELLHVFGLRLVLSKANVLGKDPHTVVAECKRYVDDLYATKRLPARSQNQFGSMILFGGYDGLAIQANETPEFRELYDYLDEKTKQALAGC